MRKQRPTRAARRERAIATIRTLWSSLESHLDFTIKERGKKACGEFGGDRKFHADTVREYAKAIHDLSQDL